MVVEYNQADITGGVTIYERLEAPKKAIIGFLINHDIAENEADANKIMLGVIVVCLLTCVSVLYLVHRGNSRAASLTPDQVRQITSPTTL